MKTPKTPFLKVLHPANFVPAKQIIDFTAAADSQIGKTAIMGGLASYEPDTLAVVLGLCDVAKGCFLDVGANIGVYAVMVSANFGSEVEVIAFEPLPKASAILKRLTEGNGLAVRLVQAAVGAARKKATFYVSAKSDLSSSLRKSFRPSNEAIEVQVITLDDFVLQEGIRPSVVKIDVEAMEPDVFRGAVRTLAEFRPWVICEVLAGRTEQSLMEALDGFGYTFYHIGEGSCLTEGATIIGDSTYMHRDWLFAPRQVGKAEAAAIASWRSSMRET